MGKKKKKKKSDWGIVIDDGFISYRYQFDGMDHLSIHRVAKHIAKLFKQKPKDGEIYKKRVMK